MLKTKTNLVTDKKEYTKSNAATARKHAADEKWQFQQSHCWLTSFLHESQITTNDSL